TFNGDLDDWPESMRNELRQEITSDSSGCTGKSCAFYSDCAFFAARRQLYEKDAIVANHALAMADLLAGGGLVLPEPGDCIYVFDEGHHLPAVAIDQGAAQTRLIGPQNWLEDLPTLPGKVFQAVAADTGSGEVVEQLGAELADAVPRLIAH